MKDNSSIDKPLETARKLLALVKRGVGGEAVNAQRALHRLMTKHSFRMEELDEEHLVEREFTYSTTEHKDFIVQCIASVIGRRDSYRYRDRPKKLFAEMTTAEHLECWIRVDHYWPRWKKERGLFYSAFIQKNKLFRKSDAEDKEDKQLSLDEVRDLKRMLAMMDGIEATSPTKRLERSEKLPPCAT